MNLDIIPQVFYDLISRVIPGFVTILAWYVTLRGPREAGQEIVAILTNDKLSGLGTSALLAVLSYLLGIILRELWSATFDQLLRAQLDRQETRAKRWAFDEYAKARAFHRQATLDLAFEALPDDYVMLDDVRRRSPSEGYRLLKLRAEAHLHQGLVTGLILLPILNVVFWLILPNTYPLDRVVLEVIVTVALGALWRAGSRVDRFYNGGTCIAWLALNFPLEPQKPTNSSDGRLTQGANR